MSLVSVLSEGTRVRNGDSYRRFVSFHSREASRGCRVPNVYHNSGQHLSQEAIFRARTKKWILLITPAAGSIFGVSDSKISADLAASLSELVHVNIPIFYFFFCGMTSD